VTPPPDGSDYSEDTLIERPAMALFQSLDWETADCFHEFDQATGSPLGRQTPYDVLLPNRLHMALHKLNPDLPAEAITLAIEELSRDRSTLSAVKANQEIYRLLKEGVRVTVRQPDGNQSAELVQVIDWDTPNNNDWFLASQFWISGHMYKRRCDLVGFVNGIPLVFIELKATHKRLEDAFTNNLRDYRTAIPQLFWYNAFMILSNGSQSRIGSTTAAWEILN
jgi:type I restriction enzyme, R subunit